MDNAGGERVEAVVDFLLQQVAELPRRQFVGTPVDPDTVRTPDAGVSTVLECRRWIWIASRVLEVGDGHPLR